MPVPISSEPAAGQKSPLDGPKPISTRAPEIRQKPPIVAARR